MVCVCVGSHLLFLSPTDVSAEDFEGMMEHFSQSNFFYSGYLFLGEKFPHRRNENQ